MHNDRIMKKATRFAALGLGLGLAVACGGSSSTDGTPGDEADINSGTGALCGGIAGLHCKKGLVCSITDSHPDATGKCTKPATGGQGSLCGGLAGLRCNAGLTCKFASPPIPDKPGTCVKAGTPSGVSKKGQLCDDGAHACAAGLVCCDTAAKCIGENDTCDNS
jgi:hypothetical protein